MKTIAAILEITDLTDDPAELLSLLDEEALGCKTIGDLLGAGEWLVSKFPYLEMTSMRFFSQVVALWASPLQLKASPSGMGDVIRLINEFSEEDLAIALANVTVYAHGVDQTLPPGAYDLAYRLSGVLSTLFGIPTRRSADTLKATAARIEDAAADLLNAVNSFIDSHAINAKSSSVEVVRKANQLKRLSVGANRSLLSELNSLLGTAFRKFCESCERQDMDSLIKRSPDLNRLAQQLSTTTDERAKKRNNSTIWHLVVRPVAKHVIQLVEEELRKSESATTPHLKLAGSILKVDLTRCDREMTIPCRLVNQGEGRALKVTLEPDVSGVPAELKILSPSGAFDVGGKAEQIIIFGLTLREQKEVLSIPVKWKAATLTGRDHWDADILAVQQQQVQPDWERVVDDPPYTLKAIKKRENLYGRNAVLTQLILNASAGTSTFLWGQKRVGKTSVVQGPCCRVAKETRICVLSSAHGRNKRPPRRADRSEDCRAPQCFGSGQVSTSSG